MAVFVTRMVQPASAGGLDTVTGTFSGNAFKKYNIFYLSKSGEMRNQSISSTNQQINDIIKNSVFYITSGMESTAQNLAISGGIKDILDGNVVSDNDPKSLRFFVATGDFSMG